MKIVFSKMAITGCFLFLVIYVSIFYYENHKKMFSNIRQKQNIIVDGLDAPRGKIFDRNGNLLVDNKMQNQVIFYNLKGINKQEVAIRLSELFTFSKPSIKEIVEWFKDTKNMTNLLSKEEKYEIKKRTQSYDDVITHKIELIIGSISNKELNIIKAYALLNDGYTYSPKVIKNNISDEEVNLLISKNIPGIQIETSYERHYPYGNTLNNIFGKIGNISKEDKNEYLKKGYNLNDIVGLSYLEKYYDDFLRGTKAKYLVNSDNSLTPIKSSQKGRDLYLTIDIDLQQKVERIIEDNIKKAKTFPNTVNLSDTFVIVSNPKTGEIMAMAGKRLLSNDEFNDITINNISSSFTMGSVVKGATMSVALANHIFDPQEKVYDSCVKLRNLTTKCSWKPLGYLDAIKALEQSSNYYQFLLAIQMLGLNYTYNMELPVDENSFLLYREMLSSYGLGIKTGIDLPNEKIGLIGNNISPDLYLNLAIGQYDTYTPIELITYINTLADKGKRRKPFLVETIKDNDQIIWQNNHEIVDKTSLNEEDYDILFKGFYNVMNNSEGTGYGYMNLNLHPAGKTGTSESFYDENNDGIVDTATITLTMAGFFPYEDPTYSLIVISPNVSTINDNSDFVYPLTYFISRQITDFMFENMETS